MPEMTVPSLPWFSHSRCCSLRGFTADIAARLAIDQVSVYPQGANITRNGKVEVPAGI